MYFVSHINLLIKILIIMQDLLTSALTFAPNKENRTIIAHVSYIFQGIDVTNTLTLQAPSTQDVMLRVFKLNDAGMSIYRVRFE